jgi:hypothetical protein
MWRNSCLHCSWHAVSIYFVWWFCQDAASDAIVYWNMLVFFSYWSDLRTSLTDFLRLNQWLLWFLTTPLLLSQKLYFNLDLPVFLVPLSCWSSCNITFVFSQNAWFGKLFSQYVYSGAHLSLSGPVWTGRFSNCCAFFWILLYMHDVVTF